MAARVEVPLVERPRHLRLVPVADHQEHPLLGFREHDLVGVHTGLALGDHVEIDLGSRPAPRCDFRGRAGESRRPHVLDRDQRVAPHELEAGLHEQLLEERIAYLDRRAFRLGLLVEGGRRHGRAVDAVAPRLAAHAPDRAARGVGAGPEDPVGRSDSEREGVDQGIQGVAVLEEDLAAHRRDPHAVPVVGDPGDGAGEEGAVLRHRQRPEAQRVHERHGAGAHREDVPQDAADPGGGALERFDEGRMVVRFDLEDGCEALADGDRAGVFAWPLEDLGRLGGEAREVAPGGFVGAVFRPHGGEHAEFSDVGGASQSLRDLLELPGGESGGERRLDGRGSVHASVNRCRLSKRRRPSTPPSTSS